MLNQSHLLDGLKKLVRLYCSGLLSTFSRVNKEQDLGTGGRWFDFFF